VKARASSVNRLTKVMIPVSIDIAVSGEKPASMPEQ
jgi:hypothetical protein